MTKQKTSIRLSPGAMELREKLAKKLGITQAAVLEQAIRLMAEQFNVQEEGELHG